MSKLPVLKVLSMRQIPVSYSQLIEIVACYKMDGNIPGIAPYEDKFEAAAKYGLQGFHGGFAFCQATQDGWGFAFFDKGLKLPNGDTAIGSVEFYVPWAKRTTDTGPVVG